MAREWVKGAKGEIWCRDNGGPSGCEYSSPRPAAIGSHQRYRHGILGGGGGNFFKDPVTTPPVASGDADDVATLMDNMLVELRRLWAVEKEFEEFKSAYAVMREAAERANAELRARPTRVPRPSPNGQVHARLTKEEAARLLGSK